PHPNALEERRPEDAHRFFFEPAGATPGRDDDDLRAIGLVEAARQERSESLTGEVLVLDVDPTLRGGDRGHQGVTQIVNGRPTLPGRHRERDLTPRARRVRNDVRGPWVGPAD